MKYLLMIITAVLFLYGCKSSILDDPSTVISYSIPERAHVKLTVENSYNTLIATLVDDDLNAGAYMVQFSSDKLPEGIYFYTLEAKGLDNSTYSKNIRTLLLVK